MELIKILRKLKEEGEERSQKALIFGIGGGGDIVSTIPAANFLRYFDFQTYHGSIVWDRIIVDPHPGPRSLEELENVEIVNETVAFADKNVRTKHGITPTVAKAAQQLGKVVALDITKGAKKLAKGLEQFCKDFDVSLVIGMDAGGDAIATGYESGVKSPLADSLCVASLYLLKNKGIESIIAVSGFGSDGELKVEELLYNISILMRERCFLGCSAISVDDYRMMDLLMRDVFTEASRIPLLAFDGEFGLKKIRRNRTVLVTPLSTLIFYFDVLGVFELNEVAKKIVDAGDIEEANRILNRAGILTEFDYEMAVSGNR
jgi:hypothetical protein